MEKSNDKADDDGGVQVQCVEAPDGAFVVTIRTLTYEELARVLNIPRLPPKRTLISHLDLAEPELKRRVYQRHFFAT